MTDDNKEVFKQARARKVNRDNFYDILHYLVAQAQPMKGFFLKR